MGPERHLIELLLLPSAGNAILMIHAGFERVTMLWRQATPTKAHKEVVVLLAPAPVLIGEAVDGSKKMSTEYEHTSSKAVGVKGSWLWFWIAVVS